MKKAEREFRAGELARELLSRNDKKGAFRTILTGMDILEKAESLMISTRELILYADPSVVIKYSNEELDEILEFLTLQVELLEQFKKDIPIKSNLLNGKGELNRTL